MKIKYDDTTDGIFFIIKEGEYFESEEIEQGVIIDYDKDENILAVEILDFKNRKNEVELPLKIIAA